MPTWEWSTEEEPDRWLDHTCPTEFEELTAKLERSILSSCSSSSSSVLTVRGVDYVLTRLDNTHCMGRDFAKQVDSRISRFALWFGLQHKHVWVLQRNNNTNANTSRDEARFALNCLTLALQQAARAGDDSSLCGVFTSDSITLAWDDSQGGGAMMESTVVAMPHAKLEDVQRIFRQYFAAPTSAVSARLTWRVPFPAATTGHRPQLLSGLVCSAVFPLEGGSGGGLFENELFSTLTAEHATLWQIQCIWRATKGGGPGFYEGTNSVSAREAALLTPRRFGVAQLRRMMTATGGSGGVVVPMDEWREQAHALVRDAFSSSSSASASPFTRLAVMLCSWLGASSVNDDDEEEAAYVKLELCWEAFCRTLRSQFETRTLPSSSSITTNNTNAGEETTTTPDLSKGEVHQKVALVQFCQQQASASSSSSGGGGRPLPFTLQATGKPAWEPAVQAWSVWSTRETDASVDVLNAQLASHMQAFKFANPLCEFVDFLRWYSPKDVLDEDEVSVRMQDGAWRECWGEASEPPLPSHLQRPLFDANIEGEKALHWLECVGARSTLLVQNLMAEAEAATAAEGEEEEEEARESRRAAVMGAGAHLLHDEVRRMLAEGDGAAELITTTTPQGDVVGAWLRGMVEGSAADKREYLVWGGEAQQHRLYLAASGTGANVRVALRAVTGSS